MKIADELTNWLNLRFAKPGIPIESDSPLFRGRFIDSIRILELIAWTERTLGRPIPDVDIRMDNFSSAERIAQVFFQETGHGHCAN